MSESPVVLIVEDGDEYLENLSRFAPGPRYLQAHSGAEALRLLERHQVALVYLDMRFDRIPEDDLLGDRASAVRSHGGDAARALRYLARHQGLFILEALRAGGHGALPVILAYDFSSEGVRFERLAARHPGLTWVPDAITPDEIRARIERLLGRSVFATGPGQGRGGQSHDS
jgi:DNA-binding NarL/FixJ family response regulator